MALNFAMLDAARNPVPLPDERVVLTVDKGVELTLVVPNAPPSGPAATSGGSGGARTLKDWGKISLSEQRVRAPRGHGVCCAAEDPAQLLFVADGAASGAPLQTLSVPLLHILATSFQQPVFGANYFAFDIRPVPNGGLASGSKARTPGCVLALEP